MRREILNIDYHRKRLMLVALNRYDSQELASQKLGISWKTLIRWKRSYNVRRENNKWIIVERKSKRVMMEFKNKKIS